MLFTLVSEDEALLDRVTDDSEGGLILAALAKGFGALEGTIAEELNSIAKVNALINLSVGLISPFVLLLIFHLLKRHLNKKEQAKSLSA